MSAAALLRAPLARTGRPLDLEMRLRADLSLCTTYRWALWRTWGQGVHLPWIMLNPSTADGAANDQTLWRAVQFSWRWGFAGVIVVNVFPFRSPHPAKLREWCRWDERRDWAARDALQENWSRVAELLAPHDAAMAAWGSPPGALGSELDLAVPLLLEGVNGAERARDLELFCLGADGRPTHPLARGKHRVPDDAVPRVFGARADRMAGLEAA